MVAEALDEMAGMFFFNVFDAKVVHDETKTYWVPYVAPEAGSVVDWCVAVGAKETDQLLFGKDTGLRKTIHATSYLYVDSSIVDNVSEFVVHDDFFGDGVDRYEHVLVFIHWCTKIVVFNVQAEPTGTWGREHAVREYFESCHVGHFHAQVAWVID